MSVKAITQLAGMPKTGPGVHKKAKRENWSSRKQEGVQGAGVEYLVPASYFSSGSEVHEVKPAYRRIKEPIITQFKTDISSFSLPDMGKILADEFALIPGYRIQVSAGHGALNPDQLEPTRYLAFRRKWLTYRGFKEGDLAIVWAKGDSMEPTIHNNDTLVVHLGRNKPSDGHIYIFRNGDELFVKRYQSMLGTWRLISDNSFYSALDIPKEEQHQFEVVGQVVHIAKDIGD
ncbi:XRE family transcriptional regulator [Vibrio parahaemolyticus]|nr:XRE family transcriptional regulator [Vibrio parahaemolyticus]